MDKKKTACGSLVTGDINHHFLVGKIDRLLLALSKPSAPPIRADFPVLVAESESLFADPDGFF